VGTRTDADPAWVLGDADPDDFGRCRDYWARNVSQNKDVKVYIAALGGPGPNGTVGYVPPDTLSAIAVQMRQSYPSFGGVMLWDASQAYGEYFRSVSSAYSLGVT
jgi:chitinase